MMKNFAESVEINHNPKWPYTPDHPYWILIFGGSGSGKTNVLLNLIKHQRPDINKVFFWIKDLFESKYQLLMNLRKNVGLQKFKNFKIYWLFANNWWWLWKLEDYNPTKKKKR